MMYWDIGNAILQKQNSEGWGAKVIDRLSHDLKETFPDMGGFSPRNLKYMRKLSESWPDREIVQGSLAQITWYHNLALLEKVKKPELRLWYARKIIENGWSRNVLAFQIETHLHERVGQTTNNFELALAGYTSPIGVAEWEKQITDSLPEDLKSSLPTIEEIEREMDEKEI